MRCRIAFAKGQEPVAARAAMEAFRLRPIKGQIVGQDATPQLSLRTGDDVERFGQFLKIVCAAQQWIVIELLVSDFCHMQDDLRILGGRSYPNCF